MKPDRFLLVSGLLGGLAAAPVVHATTFYSGVTVSTTASQYFPVNKLVQGPGVGFDAAEPHDALGTGGANYTWVTNACGANCNYFDTLPTPVLIFDLGADVPLGEISVWGYASSNTNGVKDFRLRFATAAEGTAGFGSSITYNPTFTTTGYTYLPRESYLFDNVITARYVEFTCVSNYFGDGPGGDRVGLGEVAFPVTATTGPPDISAASTLATRFARNGLQTVSIPVLNTGGSDLSITSVTLSGPDAAAFSVPALPGAIPGPGNGNVDLQFNPAAITGTDVAVTVTIASNDPDESSVTVDVSGPLNRFYRVSSITSSTKDTDLYPAENLIQGEGIGFSPDSPYARLAGGSGGLWVTGQPCGGSCDYVDSGESAVLVLDLGEDVLLSEISTWGYADTNANGVSLYSLRFATEAQGTAGFDSSVYNPTFDAPNTHDRTSHQFSQPLTARYVEFTCLDNYFGALAGGDRMGLGEIAFSAIVHDPFLSTAPVTTKTVPAAAGAVSLEIPLTNTGSTQTLSVSSVTLEGPQAGHFSVTSFPATLTTGQTGQIVLNCDPMGITGVLRASVVITSNDPLTPALTITAAVRTLPAKPLIAWWPLDDDGSDLSGNGHDGTVVGAPLFGNPGANASTGSSAQFLSDSIDVPYSPDLNPSSYTVTLWVNPLNAGGSVYRSPITSRDDVANPSGVHGFIIYNDNLGNWSFWTGGGGPQGSWNVLNADPVTTSEWIHLAITYDEISGTKTFYLNGTAVKTSTGIPFSPNGPEMQNLHIGSGSDLGDNFFFDGFIDDVAIFSVPLSAEDIGTIASNGVAAYAGLSAPPFRILTVTRNATLNEMSLIWESQANATYTVYRSTDLNNWTTIASNVGTQGATTEYVDTTLPANTPRIYYRIGRNP